MCWIALRAAVLRQGLAVPESLSIACPPPSGVSAAARRSGRSALTQQPLLCIGMMLMTSNEQRDCYAESLLLSRSSGTPGAASLVRAAWSLLFSASVP